MKVYVCIPSYNEAQNIQAITKVVDEGLQLLKKTYPSAEVHIINADSASTDNTIKLFEATTTITSKTSIKNISQGKGLNLFSFIDLALRDGADYYLTIDADITSARPDWIQNLLTPLIKGRADFSTPLYERSRYDGCITLHFAYPTMLALTGQPIRQPIGGDFAFNRTVAELIKNTPRPEAAQAYGIDIFLTLLSALHGLKIAQVPLGKKIHASGLGKLEGMFPQVAVTAAFLMHNNGQQRELVHTNHPSHTGITEDTPHLADKDKRALYVKVTEQLTELPNWLPLSVIDIARQARETDEYVTMSDEIWAETLTAWYQAIRTVDLTDVPKLAKELFPFFVLRRVSFWNEVADMSAPEVESVVRNQAATFADHFAVASAT
jgi:hypothetical protein